MASHTLRTLDRLEIVETGRRRRWSEDEKVRIVLESMAGPRLVAPTARRHNISRSMLVLWRRTFKAAASGALRPAFVQAVVAAPTKSPIAAAAPSSAGVLRPSRVEIVLADDRRVIVDEHVDPAVQSSRFAPCSLRASALSASGAILKTRSGACSRSTGFCFPGHRFAVPPEGGRTRRRRS